MDENLREIALQSNAWPFVEAKKVLKAIKNKTPEKGYVLFETGYGPSGLPHIGTFGENSRTSMVMYAFKMISDIPCKMISFSDDLDGFRKVPTNVPNQEMLAKYLEMPLTVVPDPFEKFASFGEHNNNRLINFLDSFGFSYDFYSSSKCYKSGMFNKALLRVLEKYDEIVKVILPTLGAERAETYSPFLPICEKTGKVLQAKVVAKNFEKGTITYINEEGQEVETEVTDGKCKLQWKVDWGMRWYALGVDYEMSGKDLIPSVQLSSKICRILGANPPQSFTYELFLDKNGEKISKSKGNGLSIEEWLRYGNKDSLSYYMYQKPKTAKRLYFDVIPKSVDDYLASITTYSSLDGKKQVDSPANFIHEGKIPTNIEAVSYSLILNLVSVVNSEDKELIWGFINKYQDYNKETKVIIDDLLTYAINYYKDFVKPTIKYKELNEEEKTYLKNLVSSLKSLNEETSASDIQSAVFAVGKETSLELKDWFKFLYQSLLGQDQGPRMGSFFALYGLQNSIKLIEERLK